MHATRAFIVTFHYGRPRSDRETLVEEHQRMLEQLQELSFSVVLENGSEVAYLLTFEDHATLSAYLATDEFHRMSTQGGCNDVFIKEFELKQLRQRHSSPISQLRKSWNRLRLWGPAKDLAERGTRRGRTSPQLPVPVLPRPR